MLDFLPSFSLDCYCTHFWDFLVLGFFYRYSRIDFTWYAVRGMPYRRHEGNPTFNQHNQVSPPSGHWNPETLEPRVDAPRFTGTLEPRDIGTSSAQGGKRAPTREPAIGTDPRNGLKWFRYPPWQSPAVSPLRVSLPSCSWRLRRPGQVHVGCR